MSELPRVGFIGVGAISEALITGMCVGGEQRATFLLSPRNADIANGLAQRFSFIEVAGDNQAVIDGSEIVFLAVTPQVAADVLGSLTFRPGQRVVSFIATFDMARLRDLVAPASSISRLAPLPSVARRLGPLILYPPVPEVAALLQGLGQLIQLQSESDLDALWAVTGLMAPYFGLLDEVVDWLTRQHLYVSQARPFVAALFEALAATAAERSGEGFDKLRAAHTTPGGLNEQAYRELKAAGWMNLFSQTLDLIKARTQGRATLADLIPANQQDSQVSFKR
jgi:pyrroline-5-carboxylate reductase